MHKSKTLFIGNGLNRLYGVMSWDVLLKMLDRHHSIAFKMCPFTLQFEVIMSQLLIKDPAFTYRCAKEIIRDSLSSIGTEALYELMRLFTNLPIKNIITTNYDYVIENAIDPDFNPKIYRTDHRGDEREKRYSTYRTVYLEDKKIYHIHGELKRTDSMCIGYEHYTGGIQNLRNTVYELDDIKPVKSIDALFRPTDSTRDYWLKVFLDTDVSVIGYGLDYSEIDLWWAIVYRSTIMKTKQSLIQNRIVFYGFNMDEEKIHALKLLNVDVVNTHVDFNKTQELVQAYQHIADMIQNSIP